VVEDKVMLIGRIAAAAVLLAAGAIGACDTLAPQEAAVDESASADEAALEPAAGGRLDQPVTDAFVAEPPSAEVPGDQLVFTTSLNNSQRALVDVALNDEIRLARGPARVSAAESDLDGDGTPEQFVIVKSDGWCGSGDVCNLWIYRQAGDGWQQISTGNDAAACVSVLQTSTNGYRDVRLHGNCERRACGFDMHYDGIHYMWDGKRLCDVLPGPVQEN
jgi:hypothetical protein